MKSGAKYLAASLLTLSLITGCSGNQTAQNVPGTPDYNMSQRITTRVPGTGTGTSLFGNNNGINNTNGTTGTATTRGAGIGTDLSNLTNDGYGTATDGLFGNTAGLFGGTAGINRVTGNTTGTGTTGNKTTGMTNNTTLSTKGTGSAGTFTLGGQEGATQAQINSVDGVNSAVVLYSGNVAYVATDLSNANTTPRNIRDSILSAIRTNNTAVTQAYIATDNERYQQIKAIAKVVSQEGYRPAHAKVLNEIVTGITPEAITTTTRR